MKSKILTLFLTFFLMHVGAEKSWATRLPHDETQDGHNSWHHPIPLEIWQNIASYLKAKSLIQLSLSSPQFYHNIPVVFDFKAQKNLQDFDDRGAKFLLRGCYNVCFSETFDPNRFMKGLGNCQLTFLHLDLLNSDIKDITQIAEILQKQSLIENLKLNLPDNSKAIISALNAVLELKHLKSLKLDFSESAPTSIILPIATPFFKILPKIPLTALAVKTDFDNEIDLSQPVLDYLKNQTSLHSLSLSGTCWQHIAAPLAELNHIDQLKLMCDIDDPGLELGFIEEINLNTGYQALCLKNHRGNGFPFNALMGNSTLQELHICASAPSKLRFRI